MNVDSVSAKAPARMFYPKPVTSGGGPGEVRPIRGAFLKGFLHFLSRARKDGNVTPVSSSRHLPRRRESINPLRAKLSARLFPPAALGGTKRLLQRLITNASENRSPFQALPVASRFAGAASLTQGPDGGRRFIDFGVVTQGESFLAWSGRHFRRCGLWVWRRGNR
jgi:hypothetical protein